MKIIFLDIDGVLNSFEKLTDPDATKHNKWNPEMLMRCGINLEVFPEFVKRLNKITKATDAKLVMSTSWRIGDLEWWADLVILLHNSGVKGFILGRTPNGRYKRRGNEIRAWLKEHKDENIESFIILDDDGDMGDYMDQLIQTKHDTGLQDEHVKRAIEMLNGV